MYEGVARVAAGAAADGVGAALDQSQLSIQYPGHVHQSELTWTSQRAPVPQGLGEQGSEDCAAAAARLSAASSSAGRVMAAGGGTRLAPGAPSSLAHYSSWTL